MTTTPYPTAGKLERAGLPIGPLADLVGTGGPFDLFVKDYALAGDALPGELDEVTNGTGAAVAATATTGRGMTLTTGTDDNGYAGVALSLGPWNGDLGFLAEFWLELPAAITTMKIEAGVTDALADAGAVLVKATPTATASDYAVFVYDTDDDGVIAAHSAKAGTIVATEGIDTLSASDKLYLAIRGKGDNVEFWYQANGMRAPQKVAGHGGNAGIEGATALTPWVFAQARAVSASRVLTVLRMRMSGPVI